jgi:hypothetical protein
MNPRELQTKIKLNPFSYSGWTVFIFCSLILYFLFFQQKSLTRLELFQYPGLNFIWYLSALVLIYLMLNLLHFLLLFFNTNLALDFDYKNQNIIIILKLRLFFTWLTPTLEINLEPPKQNLVLNNYFFSQHKLKFNLPKLPPRNWKIKIQKLVWQDPFKLLRFEQVINYTVNYSNLEIKQNYTNKKLAISFLKKDSVNLTKNKKDEDTAKLEIYQNQPIKYINWKISAKKNQTIVKQIERSDEDKDNDKIKSNKQKVCVFIDNSSCLVGQEYENIQIQEIFQQVLVHQFNSCQALLDLLYNNRVQTYLGFFDNQKEIYIKKYNHKDILENKKIFDQIKLHPGSDFTLLHKNLSAFNRQNQISTIILTAKTNSFSINSSHLIYLNPEYLFQNQPIDKKQFQILNFVNPSLQTNLKIESENNWIKKLTQEKNIINFVSKDEKNT